VGQFIWPLTALINTIADAQIGMTQNKLKTLFRIKVQNTLTHLVKSDKVGRQRLPDQAYVYLNTDKPKAEDQMQRGLATYNNAAEVTLPAENLIIEILLELIRTPGCLTGEKELGNLLRKRGITINDATIAYVLAYYDIKKNRS
jgi:hypothetical protein